MTSSEWRARIHRGTSKTGIVLVHDITGLDEANNLLAHELNKEGFWVAQVDLFRGKVAKDLQEGMALRGALAPGDMAACVAAGHAELAREMGAGAKIGAWGFCMGGGAALDGACHAPFDFCVDYYGMAANVDDVKNLKGPLLLLLASEDDRINTWAWGQLLPKADEHRKRVRVELFPGAAHAFHRKGWPQYDEAAAREAWRLSVAFAREHGAR